MAPKKKDKKQKEKEKEEERQRLAEEQRLADIAEAELQEKLRKQREEEEEVRRLEAARLQAELDARLIREDEENMAVYEQRKRNLEHELQTALAAKEWSRYVECNALPDCGCEAAVNSFLAEWRDAPMAELPRTLADCALAHQLQDELDAQAAIALERGNRAQADWQELLSREVATLVLQKLDGASADFLQRADEFANGKNEVLFSIAEPSCKFGLWVNLAKNPRVKSIDFTELLVSTELPKSLALASIAIRAMHFANDTISSKAAPAESAVAYMALGGVLCLELLTLPPPTKKIKGWTLRQVTALSTSVNRQPYPIPSAAGESAPLAGSAPPLRVTYSIPPHVKLPEGALQVGWFDAESQSWKIDGVSDVNFSPDTRVLSFLSSRLTSLALLQATDLELPYKNWLIKPSGHSQCTVHLETQRFLFEFDVSAQGCALREPRLPELSGLLDQPMAPTRLLAKLRDSGINLCPRDHDAAQLHGVSPKDAGLEAELHALLVPLLPFSNIAPSRWNSSIEPSKVTFRLHQSKRQEDDIDMDTGGEAAPVASTNPFAEVRCPRAIATFRASAAPRAERPACGRLAGGPLVADHEGRAPVRCAHQGARCRRRVRGISAPGRGSALDALAVHGVGRRGGGRAIIAAVSRHGEAAPQQAAPLLLHEGKGGIM